MSIPFHSKLFHSLFLLSDNIYTCKHLFNKVLIVQGNTINLSKSLITVIINWWIINRFPCVKQSSIRPFYLNYSPLFPFWHNLYYPSNFTRTSSTNDRTEEAGIVPLLLFCGRPSLVPIVVLYYLNCSLLRRASWSWS